jgi:hypothetical protein
MALNRRILKYDGRGPDRRQVAEGPRPTPLQPGHDTSVYVGCNPSRLHLFATSDGTALKAPQPS